MDDTSLSKSREAPLVTLFMPSFAGGGAERVMVTLAGAFARQGVRVDFVVARAQGPNRDYLSPYVKVTDLRATHVSRALVPLIRHLKRTRPAALLSTTDRGNLVALLARKLSGVPTRAVVRVPNVVTSSLKHEKGVRSVVMPFMAKWLYPTADLVIAVSQGVARDLEEFARFARGQVVVVYNPVDRQRLMSLAAEPISHPWFSPGAPPVILGVGRLTAQKDFGVLVRAFAQVRRFRDARLVILGEGEDRYRLETLVRTYDLQQDVWMPGFVHNPYPYMARAAVFVLSSRWEGFPNVLVEAMTLGTPVVATDCAAGPSEILDNGRYGRLVPVGDETTLAKAIMEELETDRPRRDLQRRASVFTVETIARQYISLLLRDDV